MSGRPTMPEKALMSFFLSNVEFPDRSQSCTTGLVVCGLVSNVLLLVGGALVWRWCGTWPGFVFCMIYLPPKQGPIWLKTLWILVLTDRIETIGDLKSNCVYKPRHSRA